MEIHPEVKFTTRRNIDKLKYQIEDLASSCCAMMLYLDSIQRTHDKEGKKVDGPEKNQEKNNT